MKKTLLNHLSFLSWLSLFEVTTPGSLAVILLSWSNKLKNKSQAPDGRWRRKPVSLVTCLDSEFTLGLSLSHTSNCNRVTMCQALGLKVALEAGISMSLLSGKETDTQFVRWTEDVCREEHRAECWSNGMGMGWGCVGGVRGEQFLLQRSHYFLFGSWSWLFGKP